MPDLLERLLARPELARETLSRQLLPVLGLPTSRSTSGYPYLERVAWERFRDTVPHLFTMGLRVHRLVEAAESALSDEPEGSEVSALRDACQVVRQVVLTATITAPSDLWLLRHLLVTFDRLGLLDRLLAGEAIYPSGCRVEVAGGERLLDSRELEADLAFLLARGVVEQYEDSYRIAGHPRVRELLSTVDSVPPPGERGLTDLWRRVFAGEDLEASEIEALLDQTSAVRPRSDSRQNHWIPTPGEVDLGYNLVPLVLGLRANERTRGLGRGVFVSPAEWSGVHPVCATAALEVLTAAGWMERVGDRYRVTALGERGFERAPGPFGIIETYHPYVSRGVEILQDGRGSVHVRRGDNVGASQDANRATFARANDALDRFCAETGFRYRLFVEHAIGRGEASRQRYERSGDDEVVYVGADLEAAAIDAAREEQARGRLSAHQVFVQADIGRPEVLVAAIRELGESPAGAVMMVGNGFHEVRGQTDERMVEVFRAYHEAGIVLLFTEENALSVDDLRATAWNTFHAGFKYVHEKSGQGLRPADPRPPVRLGAVLRAAWSECAERAGYVRADAWCSRTRTIYPYTPPSGFNPSISVNHFFVPRGLAAELGLGD